MNLGGTIRLNRTGWLLVAGAITLILFVHFGRDRESTPRIPEEVSGRELLRTALAAARAGGVIVRDIAVAPDRVHSKGKTKEGADEFVTDADYASHCAMLSVLEKSFPSIRVVSEETVKSCPAASVPSVAGETDDDREIAMLADETLHVQDILVWIDPLDATQEYTENLHEYVTTMVCVAVKGVPVIGVIYKPFKSEMSWGWNKAISQNLKNVITPDSSGKSPIIIVSRSHKGAVESFASEAFGNNVEIKPAGGAGYKVLEVMRGGVDAYVHTTLIKKWDICAGNAILNAAGGKMTTLKNETIDYSIEMETKNKNGLLATLKNHNIYVDKLKNMKS